MNNIPESAFPDAPVSEYEEVYENRAETYRTAAEGFKKLASLLDSARTECDTVGEAAERIKEQYDEVLTEEEMQAMEDAT